MRMKKIAILVSIFLISLTVIYVYGLVTNDESNSIIKELNDTIDNNYNEDKETAKVELKTVKIIGVGDIMLGTNYPNSSYLPPNDGRDILNPVKEIIRKGDI